MTKSGGLFFKTADRFCHSEQARAAMTCTSTGLSAGAAWNPFPNASHSQRDIQGTSTIFVLAVAPEIMRTLLRAQSNSSASTRNNSSFAFPSTGGAAKRIFHGPGPRETISDLEAL